MAKWSQCSRGLRSSGPRFPVREHEGGRQEEVAESHRLPPYREKDAPSATKASREIGPFAGQLEARQSSFQSPISFIKPSLVIWTL